LVGILQITIRWHRACAVCVVDGFSVLSAPELNNRETLLYRKPTLQGRMY